MRPIAIISAAHMLVLFSGIVVFFYIGVAAFNKRFAFPCAAYLVGNSFLFSPLIPCFMSRAILGAATLKTKGGRRAWYAIATAGMLNALWNQLLGGDDDDGVPFIDKLSDYTRERNWVFMVPPAVVEKMKDSGLLKRVEENGRDTGGRYISIPAPYIFNIPYVIGDALISSTLFGEKPLEAAKRVLLAINNSVNPVGDNTLVGSLMPTVLDPMWQLATNENFWGGNIYKQDWPGAGAESPDFNKGFHGTGAQWKAMAKWFNEISGGDQWRSGSMDFHPETLRHWYQFLTGGAGSFVNRVIENTAAATSGLDIPIISGDEPLKPEKTIFVRKVYGRVHPAADSNQYYDHREQILTLAEEQKSRKEASKLGRDGSAIYAQFMRDNRDILGTGAHTKIRNRCQYRGGGLIAELKVSDCKIRKLRSERKDMRALKQTQLVKGRIKVKEDRILEIQRAFNKRWNDKYLDQGWLEQLMEN